MKKIFWFLTSDRLFWLPLLNGVSLKCLTWSLTKIRTSKETIIALKIIGQVALCWPIYNLCCIFLGYQLMNDDLAMMLPIRAIATHHPIQANVPSTSKKNKFWHIFTSSLLLLYYLLILLQEIILSSDKVILSYDSIISNLKHCYFAWKKLSWKYERFKNITEPSAL